MCPENETMVSEFLLLGFETHQKILLFSLFLLIYIIILATNTLIIVSVSVFLHLNLPMFVFLKHLALADILFTTNIIPKMLYVIFMEGGMISTKGCFTQYYFHCVSVFVQSLVLTSMSFDRYIAICHPLHYCTVMNQGRCSYFVFWSWATGIVLMPIEMVFLSHLKFCGSKVIDHFFCDFAPILELASSDTVMVKWVDFCLTIFLIAIPFVCVIVSYICILVTIFKISSVNGRQKAFSTCSSHLVTICTYYGTIITIYIFPDEGNIPNDNKLKSLSYTIFTPLINPIIYSMRNQEIRRAFKELFCEKLF